MLTSATTASPTAPVSPTAPASTNGGAPRVAVLSGAGYVGGECVRLVAGHPGLALVAVTSRTFAGQPVHTPHPHLRGQVELAFTAPDALDLGGLDALLVAAEHGASARLLPSLLDDGFDGVIVDLSADFRFDTAAPYATWYGYDHPAPDLLAAFAYGLPERCAPYADGTRLVANPGCFATGLALALGPLADRWPDLTGGPLAASVTALTGASGSGATASAGTHFPTRAGNVRAYKVLAHQHVPEVVHALGGTGEAPAPLDLAFVPASGPWTRGIWGTAHVALPDGVTGATVASWFAADYGDAPCVRLTDGALPELRAVAGTPFADLGWVVQGRTLALGFALDNLLKGAASQAVQNLNRLLGLPEAAGLIAGAWETEGMEA
jgi:N-acetyl-gamma-glutamyl-phosphate reductase